VSQSFLTGNACLVASIVLASGGQVLLRAALRGGEHAAAAASLTWGELSLHRALLLAGAAVCIVAGFLAWALCLRHLAVSYAYTVACSSVVLVALLGRVFLGERWSGAMSLGAALIVAGTIVLFADGLRGTGGPGPDSHPRAASGAPT
jgi:drug/metabolite transporter (DMT)-like permease